MSAQEDSVPLSLSVSLLPPGHACEDDDDDDAAAEAPPRSLCSVFFHLSGQQRSVVLTKTKAAFYVKDKHSVRNKM